MPIWMNLENGVIAAIASLLSGVGVYLLKFKVHADAHDINVAKLVKDLLETDRVEYKTRIATLEGTADRLYKELQAIWNAHDEQKIKCALEMQKLQFQIDHAHLNPKDST